MVKAKKYVILYRDNMDSCTPKELQFWMQPAYFHKIEIFFLQGK